MNDLISKGVVLTTGLGDGVGRCSISEAIVHNLGIAQATVKVDDPACLKWVADPAKGVPAWRQVLFPRFVAYNAERPELFHTSLIEPPDAATPSIGLDMPAGKSSEATRTFSFGLGKLPFFEDGKFRHFSFVSVPPDENSFETAKAQATTQDEQACGMRSYLATVQSRAEQDHLVRSMETGPEGGVRSGWIGAKVGIQQQIGWVSDPDSSKNFLFWREDGVDGEPYNAESDVRIIPNARALVEFDQYPAENGR